MKKILLSSILLLVSWQITTAATPVLSANATQICYNGTTKPILAIVSGSAKTSYISGAINDPTDPAATKGILFTATNSPTSFTITSSSTAVVPLANITMTLVSGDQYICKIKPTGVGYSTITIKANNGSLSTAYTISFAASAASTYFANTVFPTGIADASGASAIDDDYMFVADDETNLLRLFNRKNSGQSLYNVDITAASGAAAEMDMEASSNASASFNGGKRIYWIGSLGNSKSGNAKPDRDRVVATDISGTGAASTLSVKSYSTKMRTSLIAWGDANSWNFTASASTANAMIPKRIDGFNIEGLSVTNEGDKAYIGFRAPCVPIKGTAPSASNRKYAIIAPITNFETMMNVNGNSSVTPVMGEPILFDFGGLGIRAMERVGGNKYVIIAGLFEGGGTPAIYLWDGVVPASSGTNPITTATSSLIQLPFNLTDLVQPSADGGVEGHPEALLTDQIGNNILVHLICDNGTVNYYNDATPVEAKTFSIDVDKYPFAKFRMDTYVYSLTGDPALLLTSGSSTQTINPGDAISPIIYTWGGGATGVTVSGLPTGVSYIINTAGKNVSISGTPSVTGTFNYTVTTTQVSGTPVVQNGTINIVAPLTAPSSVTASSTATSITLNWTPVTNANGYSIKLCKLGSGPSVSNSWDFTGTWSINASTVDANLATDVSRFNYVPATTNAPLVFAAGGNIPDTDGLLFTQGGATKVRLGYGTALLFLNGSAIAISIPCAIGEKITVVGPAGNITAIDRGYSVTGGTLVPAECINVNASGIMNVAGAIGTWVYTATSTAVKITTVTGGMNIQRITVTNNSGSSTCNDYIVAGGSTSTYTINALTAGNTYTYQLKATNADPLLNSTYTTTQNIGTATEVITFKTNGVSLIQSIGELMIKGIDVSKIYICDITGKILLSNKGSQDIGISTLNKGVYVVLIDTKDGTTLAEKFIKK